jgi:hypothetical protein
MRDVQSRIRLATLVVSYWSPSHELMLVWIHLGRLLPFHGGRCQAERVAFPRTVFVPQSSWRKKRRSCCDGHVILVRFEGGGVVPPHVARHSAAGAGVGPRLCSPAQKRPVGHRERRQSRMFGGRRGRWGHYRRRCVCVRSSVVLVLVAKIDFSHILNSLHVALLFDHAFH